MDSLVYVCLSVLWYLAVIIGSLFLPVAVLLSMWSGYLCGTLLVHIFSVVQELILPELQIRLPVLHIAKVVLTAN